jgi:hypothetical protein
MPEYIEAKIQMFPTEAGGRWQPLQGDYSRYYPHLRVGTEGEYLGVAFYIGPEKITPGVDALVIMRLLYPHVDYTSLTVGATFDILEGPNAVGTGTVLEHWTEE